VIAAALRTEQLSQPDVVTAAYAATVRAQVTILTTLQAQITTMQGQVEAHFGQHPDTELYLSQPGLGSILGARVLGEFGDDPQRYAVPALAKTTPAPARSPANPARRKPCTPGTCTTTGSSTRSATRPNQR
jgi:transposase